MKILAAILIIGIAFAGFAIKIIFKKDGEFRGTCASNNPHLKDEIGSCPVCGSTDSHCENDTIETKPIG
jgi:rRNA maturation endonuclease Nob1